MNCSFCDVKAEAAESGLAVAALVGQLLAFLAQEFDCLLFVATGILQCFLAVHQRQTGPFAE
jgi:hypothetical protein